MDLYVLDLETTTDIETANNTSRIDLLFQEEITFICASMYAPVSPTKPIVKEFYGKDNAENAILGLPEGRFYTWNGARFDMHFIYHLLRKAGYNKQEETRKNESRKKQLKKWEFNYLLAGSKLISLNFHNQNGIVEIRDACLLFTCTLKKFIENTCPEYPKLVGTYDYTKYRVLESDFTPEEIEYCRHDIYGFSVGLHRIREDFEREFGLDILGSFTAGSFAMKYGAMMLGDEKEQLFPKVSFDRNFVIGGRTFVNPIHAGKIVEGTSKIDANSFYPSIMVKSKLPYGQMKKMPLGSAQLKKFLSDNPDKYVFAHLIRGTVKYDDMFSPIVTTDDLNNRDYPNIAGSADGVYLDDNILRDKRFLHNNCVFNCYIFNATIGILDYMAKVFELKNKFKKEGKFALELAVKIILNATYGKFIQRETVQEYDFFDGVIEPTGNRTELPASWYLFAPMGAAITANCRYELCNYMNLLRERFVYCDTDSLVFTGEAPKEIPLGLELGQWKIEAQPEGIWNPKKEVYQNKTGKAIFFQRKTYAMEIDGETHVTFCGISNTAVQKRYPNGVTIEQLQKDMFSKKGITFDVLQGNHTKNGVVLVERARTKKYVERY